jgi:pyruvate,orthophosphate dikinase
MDNIIYFNKNLRGIEEDVRQRLGIRGRRAVDLAMMGLPIVPGFIIDSVLTPKLPQVNLKEILKIQIGELEKDMKKKFGDTDKPLMLKVVLSSDLNVPYFPSIHNIGMNGATVEAFGAFTGEEFAYGEYLFLLRNCASKIFDVDEKEVKKIEDKIPKKTQIGDIKRAIEMYQKLFGEKFSEDVYDQLGLILKGASARYCDSDLDVDCSLSLVVQAMVYGNFGKN